MRGKGDHGLALGQHPPPARRGRLRAQPDEAQPGFGEDPERELDRPLHDQQVGQVGQYMLDRDAGRALAADPCGEHEVERPQRQRSGAHQPGKDGDVENADGDDGVDRRGADDGRDHDRDQQRGKGEDQIVETHHHVIEQATPGGSGEQPQRHPAEHANPDGKQSHRDRRASADHDHRQNIAAEMVRPQQMVGRGRRELGGDVQAGHVVRGPQQRHQPGGDEQPAQPQPDQQPGAHDGFLRRGSIQA